jgi:hypothetical protein
VDEDARRSDRVKIEVESKKSDPEDVQLGLGSSKKTDHEAGYDQHGDHDEKDLLQPDAAALTLTDGTGFLTCHEQLRWHDIMRSNACLAGSCVFHLPHYTGVRI